MILAFDTSCDDTSVAFYKSNKIYSNVVSSQNDIHSKFGGVIPELAARKHAEVIAYLTEEALNKVGANIGSVDYVAVTVGPGLLPSLLVGVSFAKALAYANNLPIIPINHIEGHIFAPFFNRNIKYPFLSLVVSGGHTHLFYVKNFGNYELIGKTLDDAVGEAFDKVARVLGLEYPGGPVIDKLSKNGDPYKFNIPKGLRNDRSFNFSFSGVKTHVKNLVKKLGSLSKTQIVDIAASFQKVSIDVLAEKTIGAAKNLNVKTISVSGGVSANSYLREKFSQVCSQNGIKLIIPSKEMTTDNALMIAFVASLDMNKATQEYFKIEANPSVRLF